MRIGHGYDVHRLVDGRKLILGGVEIPYEKGLDGHSDAEVLTHAVMDALLGAAALGDIGKRFPDNDDRYLGADSIELLKAVSAVLTEHGWRLGNLDATVIAQRPKLAPYIDAMRARIADALGAAALGDIGKHFPDNDVRYLGADSIELLKAVSAVLTEHGWRLGNLDATVIAQRPKLAPYIDAMRARIAAALGADVSAVSVKATTEERLGFTGDGSGIAAHAVCLIEPL